MSVSEIAPNRGELYLSRTSDSSTVRARPPSFSTLVGAWQSRRGRSPNWFASWRENLPIASLRLSPIRRIVGRPIGFSIG